MSSKSGAQDIGLPVGGYDFSAAGNKSHAHVLAQVVSLNSKKPIEAEAKMSDKIKSVLEDVDAFEQATDEFESSAAPINRIKSNPVKNDESVNNKPRNLRPLYLLIAAIVASASIVGYSYYEKQHVSKTNARTHAVGTPKEQVTSSGDVKAEPAKVEPAKVETTTADQIVSPQVAENSFSEPEKFADASQNEIEAAQKLLNDFDSNQTSTTAGDTAKGISGQPGIAEIRIDNIESLARTAADSIHLLEPRMAQVEEKISAQQVKMDSYERAVTQTAQLIIATQTKISAVQADIASIKKESLKSDERIKALEEKIFGLQGKAIAQPVKDSAAVATMKSVDEPKSQPQPKPRQIEITSSSDRVAITQLRILALNGNRAVIKSVSDNKQHIIEVNKSYKNLGTVQSMDSNKIYGRFDSGAEWVIGTGTN